MARIQLRRDTTVNWLAADPVLAQGEQGLDVTTGFLYIGDGSTPISQLPPFTGDNTAVYTKTETDVLLGSKADKADTYTKDETAVQINSATLPLGQGSDVVITTPGDDDILAYDAGTANWTNQKFYTNSAYNTEDDAKAAGKNEGDVYYNLTFGKALIIGGPQIPQKKSLADAAQGEVFYNQDTNDIEIKGVRTVTVNAGSVEANADTTEPRGTLGWDPNPAVMYVSSGSFWIKIGQGRADA